MLSPRCSLGIKGGGGSSADAAMKKGKEYREERGNRAVVDVLKFSIGGVEG